jgi:hypothetical protein
MSNYNDWAIGASHANAKVARENGQAADNFWLGWEGLLAEEGVMMDFLEMILNNVSRKPGAGFAILEGTPLDFNSVHSVDGFKGIFYAKRKEWSADAAGRATGETRVLRQKMADNPYANTPPGHDERLNRIASAYIAARSSVLDYNSKQSFGAGLKSAC